MGSTAKGTELCRYYPCPRFTSNSTTSTRGHSTTITQTAIVSHQHITPVCCCTGPHASQCWWRPQCSSTKDRWRSQRSLTPRGYFWGSETVHGGKCIHTDSWANHFRWKVLNGWRSLKTSHWSPGSFTGITRCSCKYSISESIAWWSIS